MEGYDPFMDTIAYSSVVTRENIYIAFTLAALHDIKVKAADKLNECVMAPNCEKI